MNTENLKYNISLLNYTTIKVGGCSEYLIEPSSINELIYYVNYSKLNKLECRIIGAGSNTLIKDNYLSGLTICTKKLRSLQFDPISGIIKADCGVMLPNLSNYLAKNGLQGGEWTIGIPGTIGGAIFMNAGSGNFSISQNLLSVKAIDIKTLKIINFKKDDLVFKYRYSQFQKSNLMIISAKFMFEPNGNPKIINEKTRANLKKKTDSQPYHLPSFGSVFKNPKGLYAGKLIEEAGLKGLKHGGAQISNMHSNFIVNASNASSQDIYELITLIQKEILQKKGIFLHPEVRMIGY